MCYNKVSLYKIASGNIIVLWGEDTSYGYVKWIFKKKSILQHCCFFLFLSPL